MNQVVLQLGPIEIRAFTALIMAGVVVGMAIMLAIAAQHHQRLTPWLDVIVSMVVCGVIGARAAHVWLNWPYFSAHTDQVAQLTNGGLDWHGAVFLGVAGALIAARFRHVSLILLVDALALVLPIGATSAWLACAAATCGYGLEVRTLADFPSWLVLESQDIYGTVAPRLNLPPIGIALAGVLLAIVAIWTVFGWLLGLRLWPALAIYALGMSLIDFFRAEYVPMWFDHRADQVLDFGIAFLAVFMFAVSAIIRQIVIRQRKAAIQGVYAR